MSYFKILGIKPSNSLTDKDIQAAFDKKKRHIDGMANRAQISQEEKKRKIEELTLARDALMDSGTRQRLADEEADSTLRSFIKDIQDRFAEGVNEYTESDITFYSNKYELDTAVVVLEMEKMGMRKASSVQSASCIPARYDQENVIRTQISQLAANNPDTAGKISNLYEFLAYYSTNELGVVESTESLRIYSDGELLTQVKKWQFDCMQHRVKDSLTAAYNALLQSCVSMLSSEENIQLYDNSIAYQTCKALQSIASLSPNQRLLPAIAEGRIEDIQRHFRCDDATALAIYNDAIKPGEYKPNVVRKNKIQCVGCGEIVEDSGNTKAECPKCKTKLYVKCKCGMTIPAITEICPKCGRSIRAIHDIPKYVQQARVAIISWDFPRARRWIAAIEAIDSNRNELASLKSEVSKGIELQRKLYSRLDSLCDNRKYVEARKALQAESAMSAHYPRKQEIYSEIERAESLKNRYGTNLTEENATEIYSICRDISGIRLPAPQPVGGILTQYDARTGNTTIRWNASKSMEVTYSLYRMEGRVKPGMTGGVSLVKGLTDLTFIDSTVKSGSLSWYIVVVEREGLTSIPSICDSPVRAVKELDEQSIVIDIENNIIDFVWALPEGSRGIRLIRDGRDRGVPPGAERFTDSVENGRSYRYTFQVCYDFSGTPEYTSGITRDITATPAEVVSFTLRHNNRDLMISWNRPSRNAEVIFIQTKKRYRAGEVCRYEDIQEASINGQVWRAMLFDGRINVPAPLFGVYRIAAFVSSGNRYKSCQDEEYANFERVRRDDIEIDRMGTTIRVSRISVPQYASGLYISLKEGTTPFSPIGNESRLYLRNDLIGGELDFQGIENDKEYYLTFFPKYEGLELSENDASLIRHATFLKYSTYPRSEILCELSWPLKGVFRKHEYNSGRAYLSVMIPVLKRYCPAMVVLAKDNMQPSSLNDGQVVKIFDEVDEDSYRETFTSYGKRVIEFDTSSLHSGTCMRIFLKNRSDSDDYTIRSAGNWVVPPLD
ncbi:MAG: hypothetical protein IJS39_12220 [Synergistaceae bacterium]|nr:hypothetical protein [Synergistaceae bacterium]